jgi:hypothetical protein
MFPWLGKERLVMSSSAFAGSPDVSTAAEAVEPESVAEAREVSQWQRKLLPFMIRFMVVIAIGFFALSAYDVYEMQRFVASENSGNLSGRVEAMVRTNSVAQAMTTEDTIQQSLLVLEAAAMESRYRQASALLMSRIWTRQLAFLTGMVLAFLGAVFILGKMSDATSNVSMGTDQLKGAISSSSPGLILAFFGTLLMAISLVVQPQIEVQDRPLYFTLTGVVPNPNAQKVAPEPIVVGHPAPREDTGAIDIFGGVHGSKPPVK